MWVEAYDLKWVVGIAAAIGSVVVKAWHGVRRSRRIEQLSTTTLQLAEMNALTISMLSEKVDGLSKSVTQGIEEARETDQRLTGLLQRHMENCMHELLRIPILIEGHADDAQGRWNDVLKDKYTGLEGLEYVIDMMNQDKTAVVLHFCWRDTPSGTAREHAEAAHAENQGWLSSLLERREVTPDIEYLNGLGSIGVNG